MSCSAAGHTQHLGPASGHVEGPGSKVTAAALLVRDASQAQPSADGCGALLEEPSSGSSAEENMTGSSAEEHMTGSSAEEHMTGSCSSSAGSEAGGSSETSNSLRGVKAAEQAEGGKAPQAAVQLMQAQAAAPLKWPKGAPLQHLSSLQLQLLQEESSEAGDHQDPGGLQADRQLFPATRAQLCCWKTLCDEAA